MDKLKLLSYNRKIRYKQLKNKGLTDKQEKLVQLKGNTYNGTEIKNMPYNQLSKLLDLKE